MLSSEVLRACTQNKIEYRDHSTGFESNKNGRECTHTDTHTHARSHTLTTINTQTQSTHTHNTT